MALENVGVGAIDTGHLRRPTPGTGHAFPQQFSAML